MKDLPAGFEALTPRQSTRDGGTFIYLSPFTTRNGTGYNATISRDLYTALGNPANIFVAVDPNDGKLLIHGGDAGRFKVHSPDRMPRFAAGTLVKAGVPTKTRIYFTGSDGIYMSEATK